MTKQDYIKKESENYSNFYYTKETFKHGLSKGLEIAEGFGSFVLKQAGCKVHGEKSVLDYVKTHEELLEAYLTENEKK